MKKDSISRMKREKFCNDLAHCLKILFSHTIFKDRTKSSNFETMRWSSAGSKSNKHFKSVQVREPDSGTNNGIPKSLEVVAM